MRTKLGVRLAATFLAASTFSLVLADEPGPKTYGDVEEEILRQFKKVKSLEASFESKTTIWYNQGQQQFTLGKGTVWMLRDGEDVLVRVDMTSKTANGVDQKTEVVHRGDKSRGLRYTPMHFMSIHWREGQDPFAVEQLLEYLRRTHELTFEGSAMRDGAATWVIMARPLEPNPRSKVIETRYFFGKKTGLLLERIGYDQFKEPHAALKLGTFKLNAKVDKERFELKVPEGIQKFDNTTKPPPSAQVGAAAGDEAAKKE